MQEYDWCISRSNWDLYEFKPTFTVSYEAHDGRVTAHDGCFDAQNFYCVIIRYQWTEYVKVIQL